MAGGAMYNTNTNACTDASNLAVFIQNQNPSSSHHHHSFLSSGPSSSSPFLGSRSMVSFEDVHRASGSNRSFYRAFDHDENVDDELDEYFHQPEKKRRLTVEQVQFLEKSFEVENKLEPERKIQLAKDLGLQPRQVAIWFQNRRARWKTKQLEKDYDVLQTKYNTLKSDYENLLNEKDKLQSQVLDLTDKLKAKEEEEKTGQSKTESTASEVKETELPPPATEKPVNNTEPESISAKSDIFDSDSPHYTDGVHSSLLETGDSSYVFEPDQSDLSQDEDDNLISKTLLQPYIFPKLEEVDYDYSDPPTSTTASCNFGFPVEDHAFWSWSY